MKKGIVVYGFAGIGKTYVCEKYKNACDLEEEAFRYLDFDQNKLEGNKGTLKKENKEFPNNYYKALDQALKKYDYVFVTYNAIKYCQDKGIEYLMFFPGVNQKQIYLNRYKERNNNQTFTNNLSQNYELFINKEKKDSYAEKIVFLKKDEYLEDAFKRMGLIKENKLLKYKNKTLSIIIPIYNSENYLSLMLDSIKNQSYKDIEVILINDGSKDGSEEICKKFVKENANAKYIYKENGGVSSARNLGLKYVTGKYVCFLDSDDYIEKNYCECLVNTMEENACDFAMAGIYEHYQENVNEYSLDKAYCATKNNPDFFVKIFNPYWFPVLWNKIYRTSIIKNNKIKFPQNISYDEDTVFNLQYYTHTRKICVVPNKLYHYFIRNNNSLTSKGVDLVFENSLKTIPYRLSLPKKIFGENDKAIYVAGKKILKAVLQQLKANFKKGCSDKEIIKQFEEMLKNKYVKKATKYISVIDGDYCEYRLYFKIFKENSISHLKKYIEN